MMNELMNAMMRGRVRVGDDWSIEDEDFLWSEIDLNNARAWIHNRARLNIEKCVIGLICLC